MDPNRRNDEYPDQTVEPFSQETLRQPEATANTGFVPPQVPPQRKPCVKAPINVTQGPITLHVRQAMSSNNLSLTFEPSSTIEQVYSRIVQCTRRTLKQFCLVFRHQELNLSNTIESAGLYDGATIDLVVETVAGHALRNPLFTENSDFSKFTPVCVREIKTGHFSGLFLVVVIDPSGKRRAFVMDKESAMKYSPSESSPTLPSKKNSASCVRSSSLRCKSVSSTSSTLRKKTVTIDPKKTLLQKQKLEAIRARLAESRQRRWDSLSSANDSLNSVRRL